MMLDVIPWVTFMAFVVTMLALDLGVFHRRAHVVSRREALLWSGVWIALAVAFNLGVYALMGADSGLEWTTGYLIEKSLSVDNVFLFILIFISFAVPPQYQHRVLFWGILGALVMRGVLIALGAFVLDWFHYAIYAFGALLIVTGIKFLRDTEQKAPDIERNVMVRAMRRIFPVDDGYTGDKLFVFRNGVLHMTPLFLVLLVIESTDLIFAIDSIPAVFAITDDPFIVFTSNVFAILGLRSLYFVLNGYLTGLAYLKPALATILVFVGSKMVFADVYKIHPLMSLAVIVGVLFIAITASLLRKPAEHEPAIAIVPVDRDS
jgi:tellurite resistance protein TerC